MLWCLEPKGSWITSAKNCRSLRSSTHLKRCSSFNCSKFMPMTNFKSELLLWFNLIKELLCCRCSIPSRLQELLDNCESGNPVLRQGLTFCLFSFSPREAINLGLQLNSLQHSAAGIEPVNFRSWGCQADSWPCCRPKPFVVERQVLIPAKEINWNSLGRSNFSCQGYW